MSLRKHRKTTIRGKKEKHGTLKQIVFWVSMALFAVGGTLASVGFSLWFLEGLSIWLIMAISGVLMGVCGIIGLIIRFRWKIEYVDV